jgi:hypothetical protein
MSNLQADCVTCNVLKSRAAKARRGTQLRPWCGAPRHRTQWTIAPLAVIVNLVHDEETPRESEPTDRGGDGFFAFISDTLRYRDVHDREWWHKFGIALTFLLAPVMVLGLAVFPPLGYAAVAITVLIIVVLFVSFFVFIAIDAIRYLRQRDAK